MDLRVLFIHPVENERDSFRRSCLDEDFNVDTASDIAEAYNYMENHNYDMVFVNRKLGGEEITKLVNAVKAKNPNAECVMGVQSINKADLLQYQNETGFYHMYLEPVNYRKDLLPLVENFMLESKARMMGKINQGAKESEARWNKLQDFLVSTLPGKKDSVGHLYAYNVLRHYHQMSMTSIMYISELQKEIADSYSNHKELHVTWDVGDSARRILEYKDADQKLLVTRILCQVCCAEAVALADGYKVDISIKLDVGRHVIHIHSQAVISRLYKSDDDKLIIISSETDGIFSKFCSEYTVKDELPGGIWIHTRDGIFDEEHNK